MFDKECNILNELVNWQAIDSALGIGDMTTAARLAEAMLMAGHRYPMLFNLAAWAREEAGAYAEAHALLAEALTIAPDDPLIHLSIGAIMRKEGRLDAAFATFARVANLLGDNPAYWLERGYAYEAAGAYEAAAADFERAVQLDWRSAPALAAQARALSRIGQTVAARASAEQALAIDPAKCDRNYCSGALRF